LEHDSVNDEFILTDTVSNRRNTFHDFTVTPSTNRGRLKEQSFRGWHSQGKAGFTFTYSSGQVSQITTPTGQDFNIVYTYSGGLITKVAVENASEEVIAQVDYSYYDDVTTPSADLGSSGDFVQVK